MADSITVDGVTVSCSVPDMQQDEVKHYIKQCKDEIKQNEPKGTQLVSLAIGMVADGRVALSYTVQPPTFERIRRITGYLVGSTDRWNNAKRAELNDRVKHCGRHGNYNVSIPDFRKGN